MPWNPQSGRGLCCPCRRPDLSDPSFCPEAESGNLKGFLIFKGQSPVWDRKDPCNGELPAKGGFTPPVARLGNCLRNSQFNARWAVNSWRTGGRYRRLGRHGAITSADKVSCLTFRYQPTGKLFPNVWKAVYGYSFTGYKKALYGALALDASQGHQVPYGDKEVFT